MISWGDAHRLAVASTTRLLRDQKVDPQERVPLDQIAGSLGLVVRYAPLPRMAGAYICEEGSPPGVLVNSRHPAPKQRYTLAHEIGHHVLGHATSLDVDTELMSTASTRAAMPDHERLAEAFAAWLLMPRSLVQRTIRELGPPSTPLEPIKVYRASLRIGSSYVATCHHLVNLRLINGGQRDAFVRVRPQTLKQQLLGPNASIGIGAADVHLVTADDRGTQVHAGPGDIIVITNDVESVDAGGLAVSVPARQLAFGTMILRAIDMPPQNPAAPTPSSAVIVTASDGTNWSFILSVEPLRYGVSERWFSPSHEEGNDA